MFKLINDDCTKVDVGEVDVVICDPPYGTTKCKWDVGIPFDWIWSINAKLWVMFGAEPFSSIMRVSNIKNFKYDWVWNKKKPVGFLNAKRMPLKQHEIISVFGKHVYNPQPYKKNTNGMMSNVQKGKSNTINGNTIGKSVATCDNSKVGYPRSIIDQIPVLNNLGKDKSGLHPTQKPLALMEYLVKTYTNEGDTVLDPTMGSGTTGLACKNLNRNFIGIEKDKKYFEIAEARCLT